MDITDRKEAQSRLEHFAEELERQVAIRTAELSESQDRLRALATELNLTEQRERKRLATELHDHLQQTLALGKMHLSHGKRFALGVPGCETTMQKVDDILAEALAYTRTLVAELSPPVLRDHGLALGLKWLGQYMHKHNMTVSVTVPDHPVVHLPEDQEALLYQSVRELLMNSLKHAGTGCASVSLQQHDGKLEINVSDEGRGFDLAAAAAAAAGTNLNGAMSSKFGLFAIRERMRALGGSFNIQSEPDQGTRATLMLPLGKVVGSQQMIGEAAEELRVNQTEKGERRKERFVRVLLVDDHAMVRQGLTSILNGYADLEVVGEADNGIEALSAVEAHRPAVIVMDINMPKMDGIEATRRIKARYPDIAIIGLSVNVGRESRQAMLQAGAAMLLTKEEAVEHLYRAIQEVMNRDRGGLSTSHKVTI
ncbi:MAG TPA: response regulator [Nitrospira sp.]|nr:response regulator [Nitrospira sp.]